MDILWIIVFAAVALAVGIGWWATDFEVEFRDIPTLPAILPPAPPKWTVSLGSSVPYTQEAARRRMARRKATRRRAARHRSSLSSRAVTCRYCGMGYLTPRERCDGCGGATQGGC